MAKKRLEIGNLVTKKDNPKQRSIKINVNPKRAPNGVTLKNGDWVNFETMDEEVTGLNKALADGKLDEKYVEDRIARNMKDREFGTVARVFITVEE